MFGMMADRKRKRGDTMSSKNVRPIEERLAELNEKADKIRKQKRALQSRANAQKRKARTKRLISIGAEVEAYCGEITNLESFRKYLEQYKGAIRATQKSSDTSGGDERS